MINMFKIIDDTFIDLWNRVHNTHASAAWITQVQTQLSEAVPAHLECTDVQGVQIRITQQWLRSQAWQLSVCQGLVSSVSNNNALTFKYPIEIARVLLKISHKFPQQALDAHGTGLVS
jgi:predicted fused transcriptional regulator/phosphomethylpyrimidine kinase